MVHTKWCGRLKKNKTLMEIVSDKSAMLFEFYNPFEVLG